MLNELLSKPSRLVNLDRGIQHFIRDNKKEDICKLDRLLDDILDGLALVIVRFIVEFLMDELELFVEWLNLVRNVITTFGQRHYYYIFSNKNVVIMRSKKCCNSAYFSKIDKGVISMLKKI